jgi:hypothetical protein
MTRGIVFAMIGVFLVVVGRKFNSGDAAGLAGALRALRRQPYGPYPFGLAGAGFLSYGAFELLQSIVRRIDVTAIRRRRAIWGSGETRTYCAKRCPADRKCRHERGGECALRGTLCNFSYLQGARVTGDNDNRSASWVEVFFSGCWESRSQ